MTNQNNQQVPVLANTNVGSAATRVWYFVRMNLPEFVESQIGEDPQNFIDEVEKIFGLMKVIGNDQVELASDKCKDVAHTLYTQLKKNSGTDIPWSHGIFNDFSLSLVCVQKLFCIDF